MPKRIPRWIDLGRCLAAAFGVCLLWSGCGKKETPTENLGPKMTGGASKAPAPSPAPAPVAEKSNLFLSMFSTNEPRDPFNPKARAKPPVTAAAEAVVKKVEQDMVLTALQDAFTGVFGGGNTYVAVFNNNEMLELKRYAFVSLAINGERKKLRVRPVKIIPGLAELEVEGIAHPVAVKKGAQ